MPITKTKYNHKDLILYENCKSWIQLDTCHITECLQLNFGTKTPKEPSKTDCVNGSNTAFIEKVSICQCSLSHFSSTVLTLVTTDTKYAKKGCEQWNLLKYPLQIILTECQFSIPRKYQYKYIVHGE